MSAREWYKEPPLHDRVNGQWTEFEARLFNLITSHGPSGFLFSKRLQLTEAAIRGIKIELELMDPQR